MFNSGCRNDEHITDKDVKEAIRKVLEAGRKYKLSSGFHSVSSKYEDLQKFIKQKFNFLAFSLDSIFLGDKAFEDMKNLCPVQSLDRLLKNLDSDNQYLFPPMNLSLLGLMSWDFSHQN